MILREHRYLFTPPARVLDVAPAPSVRRFMVERIGKGYVGTDMFMSAGVSVRSDLTGLCFATHTFDAIVCYHVLEHIPDDARAIAELARVLKPGGLALVQVPRRSGRPTDEDPEASVEERIRRFGQDDHVRFYGDDFEERLRKGGLAPTVVRPAGELAEADVERLGLDRSEEIWICRSLSGMYTPLQGGNVYRPSRRLGLGGRRAMRRLARVPIRALRRVRRRLDLRRSA
jgi:SAM-dependent methyltransferase